MQGRGKLILLNGIFFALGVSILSVGLWSRFDPHFSALWNSMEVSKVIDARGVNGASMLLVISGLTSVLISFIGLYGSVKKDKCFLITYALLIFMVLMLEIASSSVIIAYRGTAAEHLKEGLNKTVQTINTNQDKVAIEVMNSLQVAFQCCGCDGKEDYRNLTAQTSCETKDSTDAHKIYWDKGCYDTIIAFVRNNSTILLTLAICISLLQMICVAFSLRLFTKLDYETYEEI